MRRLITAADCFGRSREDAEEGHTGSVKVIRYQVELGTHRNSSFSPKWKAVIDPMVRPLGEDDQDVVVAHVSADLRPSVQMVGVSEQPAMPRHWDIDPSNNRLFLYFETSEARCVLLPLRRFSSSSRGDAGLQR